jgi:nitrogen-specific signal transduction histidine kinase
VLFLTPNGLIRKANTAARNILGFASPAGMTTAELFRDATVVSPSGSVEKLAAVVNVSLQGETPARTVDALYVTPSGEERVLEITITAVRSSSGEVLGSACLISDKTKIAMLEKQQELRGEISAEMALALRNSLSAISGYARQLAASRDAELARQLAADIVSEAAHLDHTIGGFLAGDRSVKAAKAAAGA